MANIDGLTTMAALILLNPAGVVEGWFEDAECARTDPEAFFPAKGASAQPAKRVCLGCHVRDACLSYALANDEQFGVWGGLSERERRKLLRRARANIARQQVEASDGGAA